MIPWSEVARFGLESRLYPAEMRMAAYLFLEGWSERAFQEVWKDDEKLNGAPAGFVTNTQNHLRDFERGFRKITPRLRVLAVDMLQSYKGV